MRAESKVETELTGHGMLDLLTDPYVVCDAALHLVWANGAAWNLSRLQESRAQTRSGEDVCSAFPWLLELRSELESHARSAVHSTPDILRTEQFEHRLYSAGGNLAILSLRPSPAPCAGPAAAAIAQAEERLQLAQEVARLAVWDRNLETGEIHWSPEMFGLVGLEPASVVPTLGLWRELIHPDDLGRVLTEAIQTIRARSQSETEYRIVRSDGSARWILSRWRVFCDPDGKPNRMVGVNLDITERREMDIRLRDINEQLTAIIAASPAPIVALSPNGLITLWNPAAEELFGWRADEVLGKEIPFIPQTKRAEHAVLRDRDLRGESLHAVQLRRIRKDGAPIDISVSTATLRDGSGNVTGIMSLYEDITDRLRAEIALKESEQRFRTLTEATPQLVWSTDADGLCDYLSRQWVDYTGVPEHAHLGLGWTEALHPDDRERSKALFLEAVAGRADYDLEYRLRRHDGVYRWFKTRGLPVTGESGRVLKWLGTCTDIEDQRRIMDALVRANADLEQFAYAAAHDLQEPLRNIAVYNQLLQRRFASQITDEARKCLNYSLEGAQRMQALVEDLLVYTRAAGEETLPASSVDCGQVFDEALENLKSLIEMSGASVEATSPLPRVWAHKTRLIQVFQNLISNALKYHGTDSPRIRVSALRKNEVWEFSVRDNGVGIRPEYHDRIFGVFRRLHGREIPGTGIGLAICRRIVEQYGGRIWVSSEGSGTGSSFCFTLPAAQGE